MGLRPLDPIFQEEKRTGAIQVGNTPSDGSAASGAIAGTPGIFVPPGATVPADLTAMAGLTPFPGTAWTTGQHVVLGDASHAYWDGSAWSAGDAP